MANKNKNSDPLGGINFLHNPFQSFMASKTSNGHWSKVNSTYRLKVGNRENEKLRKERRWSLGKKESRVLPRTFCKICQRIFYHTILRVE